MIWLLLVLGVGVAVYLLTRDRGSADVRRSDPETVARAATELHRIRSRLSVAWTPTEIRRDSARLRREIGEALDDQQHLDR
jgi:hypothetical protein